MDLSLHPARFPALLEKWYIDALLDDGAVLIVYMGALTVLGARLFRLTAEYHPPAGPATHGSAVAHRVMGGEGWLRFGPALIEGDRVRFATAALSGDLVYQPRWPPVALAEPFLRWGNHALHWTVEVPDADVSGTLSVAGARRAVAGRGYRDRVWFDQSLRPFPIQELVWGRAVAGPHAATWVRAQTPDTRVAAAWLDGAVVAPSGADGLPGGVTLGSGRVFIDTDVAALEGLRLGALRGPLRRLAGDPHETKWQADCEIAGKRGMAVHEVARWQV